MLHTDEDARVLGRRATNDEQALEPRRACDAGHVLDGADRVAVGAGDAGDLSLLDGAARDLARGARADDAELLGLAGGRGRRGDDRLGGHRCRRRRRRRRGQRRLEREVEAVGDARDRLAVARGGLEHQLLRGGEGGLSNSGPADVVTAAASTAPLGAIVRARVTDAFSAAAFLDSGYSGVASSASSGGTRPAGADGAAAVSWARASGTGAAKVARRNPMTKVRPAWALMSGPFRKARAKVADRESRGNTGPGSVHHVPAGQVSADAGRSDSPADTRDPARFLTAFASGEASRRWHASC